MGEKKSLEEKIIHQEQKRTGWIEPMKEWIKEAGNLPKIAREDNLLNKKVMAKKIFGSNLCLAGGQVVSGETKNDDSSPKNVWSILQLANEFFIQNPKSFNVVPRRGLEPPRDCSQRLLRPPRLPISTPRQKQPNLTTKKLKNQDLKNHRLNDGFSF